MSKHPAPEFNPFRPRVTVALNPHLSLVCYAPSVDDGLKAERILEATAKLAKDYDAERDDAATKEAIEQLWSLVVDVKLLDELGAAMPTPKDWRDRLEADGTLEGEFGAQAWAWLFRRHIARRATAGGEGSGGRGARPGVAPVKGTRKHAVSLGRKAVPSAKK